MKGAKVVDIEGAPTGSEPVPCEFLCERTTHGPDPVDKTKATKWARAHCFGPDGQGTPTCRRCWYCDRIWARFYRHLYGSVEKFVATMQKEQVCFVRARVRSEHLGLIVIVL